MDKKYVVVIIALLVFFIVVFSFSKLSEVKSNLNDSANNYEYHIIYYDYENTSSTTKTTDTTKEDDEDFGDYYDDPLENEEDIESETKSEIYLPIHIYKKGNKINVSKEFQPQCTNAPCEVQTMDYEIKFSKDNKEIISDFIVSKFTGSNEKEITLYKNNLSKRETKIINSLLNNDESYLN